MLYIFQTGMRKGVMTALIDRNVIYFSNRDAQGVMTAFIDRNVKISQTGMRKR